MRFLFDVCFPDLAAGALEADGHDCAFMRLIDARADDAAILSNGLRDEQIVVTRDWDYGELVMRRRLPTGGVIILAIEKEDEAREAQRLLQVVRLYGDGLRGWLTVVDDRRVRRRLAPSQAS